MPIDYVGSTPTQKTDAEYQAEDDAHTLARAEAIKADEKRVQAAREAAQKMLEGEKQDVRLLKKVAGRQSRRSTTPTPAGSRTTRSQGVGSHNVFNRIKG